MLGEDTSAVGIDLAEGDGSHSGALEAEAKSADAAEKIENIHLSTALYGNWRSLSKGPFGLPCFTVSSS